MKYILIVIFINGGSMTAEFNNKRACLETGAEIAISTGDKFSCKPKGDTQLAAAFNTAIDSARLSRDQAFHFIKFMTEYDYGY